MNIVITIKCLPSELEKKLSDRRREMGRDIETAPGWTNTVYPDFSLQSVVHDGSPTNEMVHYINVTYKR